MTSTNEQNSPISQAFFAEFVSLIFSSFGSFNSDGRWFFTQQEVGDWLWSKTGCVWPRGPRFCITFGGKTGTHAKPPWNLTVLVFGLSIFFNHVGLVEHVQIRSFSSASLDCRKICLSRIPDFVNQPTSIDCNPKGPF